MLMPIQFLTRVSQTGCERPIVTAAYGFCQTGPKPDVADLLESAHSGEYLQRVRIILQVVIIHGKRAVRIFSLFLVLITGSFSASRAQNGAPAGASFSLQPGDVISVEVWREEDLTGEFLVDENGDVILPLLGEIHVAGVPIGTLRDSLMAAYREELRNPSIIITPLRRVYVLGEVNDPGLFTVDPTISLAGAVAMAGGANSQGDLGNIRVVRGGEVREGLRVDSQLASADILSGDQIFVGRRSWFDRNSTFIVSALLSVTSIIISLAR